MEKEEKQIMLKTLLLALIIGSSMFLISLIFLIFFDSISWSIGIAIGVAIELINIVLLYVGSSLIAKKKAPMYFLIFYFLRMITIASGVVLCALLGYGPFGITPVPAFKFSVFGLLIGYTPLQIVVSIIEMKRKITNK